MIPYSIFRRYLSETSEIFPAVYLALIRFRLKGKPPFRKILAQDSVIMIEGFPRCANSFAVKAFRHTNDADRRHLVATHLHSHAHVRAGIRQNLPLLVVIRDPDQAVPSLLALAMQLNKNDAAQQENSVMLAYVCYWTGYYVRFYERLLPHRDSFVLGEFTKVTTDFDSVISEINAKFGTKFLPFGHTNENVQAVFDSAKVHLSPSAQRDDLKVRFEALYHSPENKSHRERARATFLAMVAS